MCLCVWCVRETETGRESEREKESLKDKQKLRKSV
jgi:hypothetical protein